MTHWNYRLCKETYRPGTEFEEVDISLREVYYNDLNEITAVTENAVGIHGESLDEIKRVMEYATLAINKDVVDLDTIVFAKNTLD